jgi:pimeloyl-ACP methyl ester carboxylesterase
MDDFLYEGHRIEYDVYGTGQRVLILVHGLLMNRRMFERLGPAMARRGNRVICVDLLGHGRSDRPLEPWRYSIPIFARQIVALLDHLELDEAVIFGSSLGANTTLEVGRLAPSRVRGMVVEMPVLDHALIACVIAFTPLMLALTFGGPLTRLTSAAARAVPQRLLPFWGDLVLDTVRQDPKPGGAVMQGLFAGRIGPNTLQRRQITAPALVIGHRRDPVHPLTDAGMLADELPNGRLLEADSIVELRVSPGRLTGEIAGFLDECWKPKRRAGRRTGGATRPA